jgi:hypothetical protein
MRADDHTTIAGPRQVVADSVDARDWHPFHGNTQAQRVPWKNLSMSIAIEAAELMERFQ